MVFFSLQQTSQRKILSYFVHPLLSVVHFSTKYAILVKGYLFSLSLLIWSNTRTNKSMPWVKVWQCYRWTLLSGRYFEASGKQLCDPRGHSQHISLAFPSYVSTKRTSCKVSTISLNITLLEEWKTNLMSLAILFHLLCAQHVSDINISHNKVHKKGTIYQTTNENYHTQTNTMVTKA